MVAPPQLHHIAITVTDLDVSIPFYEQVFGLKHRMDEPHQGGIGRLLATDTMDLVIVLHRHDANDGGLFAETSTGLDHAGFHVENRDVLVQWQDHLEANGVERTEEGGKPLTQSPITDRPYGSVLVFRDPDNIQLELFAPPT